MMFEIKSAQNVYVECLVKIFGEVSAEKYACACCPSLLFKLLLQIVFQIDLFYGDDCDYTDLRISREVDV